MPRLTLLLGLAGSGKTHRVLDGVARAELDGGLPAATESPMLIIVPEQQAVATERALLARIAELSDGRVRATARSRVLSLTRLAHLLAERAGVRIDLASEQGRALLLWRLLDDVSDPAERHSLATVLSGLVAELSLHGTSADELQRRATALATAQPGGSAGDRRRGRLGEKLALLARVYGGYCRECAARELQHEPPAALIPGLLRAGHWPELAQAQVWIDGFAGFTPAEERALQALTAACAEVTATLLLDPACRDQPREDDPLDWYAPTRETYRRWLALAAGLGIPAHEATVPDRDALASVPPLPRWPSGSLLAELARHGPYPRAAGCIPAVKLAAYAVVCADERAEVDACARRILDLAADGLRFGEISVVLRRLEPYAGFITTRFSEHGIPFFLDRREPLSHHPAVELVRCALRLALDQAADDDVLALLRTGLLPLRTGAAQAEEWRGRVDQLEDYALEHGLRAHHWLRERPWDWWRGRHGTGRGEGGPGTEQQWISARLAELDGWRCELLHPVTSLRQRLRAEDAPTVRSMLTALWEELLTPELAAALEQWAQQAGGGQPPQPGLAAQHRGVLAALAQLSDELVLLAGDVALGAGGLSRAGFCQWLEFGLVALSQGQPPSRLDHVLVTDIERGRHHPVRAALLLGMADDLWPPAPAESPYLADNERALLNEDTAGDGGRRLLGRGAAEDVEREPYLALVAVTRATERLYLSRPGADAQGAARPPSLYFTAAAQALRLAGEQAGEAGHGTALADVGTAVDLAICLALRGGNGAAAELLTGDSMTLTAIRRARSWGHRHSGRPGQREALAHEEMQGLLGTPVDGRLLLRGSPSRLEAFAACPYQHFARYFLKLRLREEPSLDARDLGSFYHRIFQRTVARLNDADYHWPGTPQQIWQAALAVLDESSGELAAEAGRERVPFIIERARLLCWHHAHWLHQQLVEHGRTPGHTELSFGRGDAAWPPLVLTEDALRLEISGSIDRLDLDSAGLPTVVDYKFHGSRVDWARFLAGQQLQLFAYLLAVRQHQPTDTTGIAGAAVEYQPIEPQWRGGVASFKAERIALEQTTAGGGDAAPGGGVLPAALEHTGGIMLELAGRLCRGDVAPWPLRHLRAQGWTACGMCDYRAVCRFDPLAGDAYRDVAPGSNRELRDALLHGQAPVMATGEEQP